MSALTKTWWGERLLDALEDFTDSGRLVRGRSYASDNRVKQWVIKKGVVQAKIRGNKNPYFGVYTEPTYKTEVKMVHLSEVQWKKIIAKLTQRASFIAKLLVDEIPENIEDVFAEFNTHLLPNNYKDFKVSCSCPDYEVPCKHIAGVCYRLAGELDNKPLLLFEMRGISPEKLHQELIKSPLGKTLADAQTLDTPELVPVESFYTQAEFKIMPDKVSLKQFWQGEIPLPKELPPHQEASIPAVLVKKGGDYPAFWHKQSSFIEVMEDFYIRMRKSNQKQM
ncbi:MAG: hypothetical protein GQ475_06915 [Methylococcaceae bacterium]|nr:hypothetical protein [Methylococcaceae bacterium]